MRIALRWVILAGLVLLAIASVGCPLDHPVFLACCGDSSSTPPRITSFTQAIATRADEVPVELQGCGFNREETSAISITGTLVGCVFTDRVEITFPNLVVNFTTSAARCGGTQGVLPNRIVRLENVVYSARIRPDSSPVCATGSSVTWRTFDSTDWGFATLFRTNGPNTLRPILDRYALGWLASVPPRNPSPAPATCPPRPIFGGTTTRCPS